jgi:hypothetical protein
MAKKNASPYAAEILKMIPKEQVNRDILRLKITIKKKQN